MNSNFEWQKHQANERVQKYQQEAAAHRQVKEGNGRKPGNVLLVLAMLAGVFFVMWLTVGCTSQVSMTADVPEPQSSGWVMADRIDFQDKREAYLEGATAVSENYGGTMADRIYFQDRREAYLDWRTGVTTVTDHLLANNPELMGHLRYINK